MSDTSSATPELDKQSKIINSGESAAVSDFLDWLIDDQGLGLVKHNVTHEVEMPCAGPSMMTMKECDGGRVKNHRGVDLGACTLCGGTGWVSRTVTEDVVDTRSPLVLIADYFGIDLQKIEQERRILLDQLQAAAGGQ